MFWYLNTQETLPSFSCMSPKSNDSWSNLMTGFCANAITLTRVSRTTEKIFFISVIVLSLKVMNFS